jgi:hypothetical protein
MSTSNDRGRHPLQTIALFAAGTIVATLVRGVGRPFHLGAIVGAPRLLGQRGV